MNDSFGELCSQERENGELEGREMKGGARGV
jgi:hypothetical protein